MRTASYLFLLCSFLWMPHCIPVEASVVFQSSSSRFSVEPRGKWWICQIEPVALKHTEAHDQTAVSETARRSYQARRKQFWERKKQVTQIIGERSDIMPAAHGLSRIFLKLFETGWDVLIGWNFLYPCNASTVEFFRVWPKKADWGCNSRYKVEWPNYCPDEWSFARIK